MKAKERTMKPTKTRKWTKPIVQDEQVGMEVTTYASAVLDTL
jgi:coenzyme PQQ precursor peptide PqqA